jgi:hypothetical protein
MNGLEARVNYARAKVLAIGYPEQAADTMQAAQLVAYCVGMSDFRRRAPARLPIMFVGAPELIDAWHEGFSDAEMTYEMATCSGCQNEFGNPCSTHG